MGIFIKKINGAAAESFFVGAYTRIVSDQEIQSHIAKLDELKKVFPILKGVEQERFNEELTAVNLELLDIAWTKYCVRKRVGMSQVVNFIVNNKPRIEALVPKLKEYESQMTTYNQAFGSSYTDGNTEMAAVFVSRILKDVDKLIQKSPKAVTNVVDSVSYLFVGTFKVSTDFIEQHKLIG